MALFTTLSSVGVSNGLILNPVAKKTTIQLSANQASSLDVTIQVTLDDATELSPTLTWTAISTVHYSSLVLTSTDGVLVYIDSPIAGIRINSSTMIAGTVLTLKALQSVTA